ncbi:TPA: hypothetical protein ACH3X1_007932 [Trebouxia sp. C0004]
MMHRAAATGQEISALEAVTIDAVSLEELVGHCLQLLQENHTRISSLEEYLQQYGYKPPDNLSVPVNPLELVMPPGVEDTPANMQPDNPSTTVSSIKEQAHQASQRQPFRQVTNHTAGASPPIRQQPAVGVSKALQTRYMLQTVSVDRIMPTPSPILSSSTDMPYSPSMRELQVKYGAASFDSHGGNHRESIESVSMPAVEQACHRSSLSPSGPGHDAHALMTPLNQHQLLPCHMPAHPAVAGDATAVATQMAGCRLSQDAAAAAASGSVLVAEEESTMCLRDQLIHSRCTEQSTPEPCVLSSPVRPTPFQSAARSGSSCHSTPDHHQALAGQKPATPDTAILLQRALASSGSIVLNRLTASNSLQPLHKACGLALPQVTGGSGNTHSLLRLEPDQQQQSGATQSAVGAGQQAQAGQCEITKPLSTDLGPQQGLPQPLEKAHQQVDQRQQEPHGHQSEGEQQAGKAEQEVLKTVERSQRPDQQGGRAEQHVKGQHQAAVPTPKFTPILTVKRIDSADVCMQSVAVDSSLTEGEELKGTKRIAAHVTQDEYMDLGIMQRKHFALDQINHAVDLMQSLSHAGSTFKAEDLSSLQVGDMKTKMLLGALTKLGKLRVQVDNGQIIGYRMEL